MCIRDRLTDKQDIDLSKVTHQIVDRPVLKNKVANRTYVQPQWIFDSINKCELVPANLYLPGEPLPPHLSPWGDSTGYDPTAENDEDVEGSDAEEIDESADEDAESEEVEEDDTAAVALNEDDEDDEDELRQQKELELEAQGISYSEAKDVIDSESSDKKKKKKRKATEEEEEKDLKLIMMSNCLLYTSRCV